MRSYIAGGCLAPLAAVAQLAFSALVMAGPAEGEPAAAGGLEEIVVTATRREERLQDVPISVVAFDQAKLDAQGVKSIDDLARVSPGFNVQRNGAAYSYNDEFTDINIRGVDSTAGTSTTGLYIDEGDQGAGGWDLSLRNITKGYPHLTGNVRPL